MIYFFQLRGHKIIAVEDQSPLDPDILLKLEWLFDGAGSVTGSEVPGIFCGSKEGDDYSLEYQCS